MDKPKQRPLAVAIRYEQQDDAAPKVVATGRGKVAERIVEVAREAKVPVQERPEIAETLGHLEVGSFIPEELYGAVAEILAYVYYLDSQLSKKQTPG